MTYVIGVDVGGTFTDAVLGDAEGRLFGAKVPSTPPDYSRGVMDVLRGLAVQLGTSLEAMLGDTHHIAHGTTSSLNALVTGNVPPVGFLTTQGHRDSIFIMNVEGRYLGRGPEELQNVLGQTKEHGLLPKRLALEVTERLDRDGTVVVKLDEAHAKTAIAQLLAEGVSAIAVSLLWSFKNPAHEQRLRELIHEQAPRMFVSLSSEVSPRIREFSRNATTIMSAQIGPGLRSYLGALEGELRDHKLKGPLLVMQSNGGAVAASEAPSVAISTVGSVLTGGVIGSVALGQQLGHQNIISTDVGGTTFLAGLVVGGEPVRASSTIIRHHPVNVPTLQVHAIGSGGGAIAWLDRGRNLRVGPRSAGAVPGPACYDQGGTEPTNTDANLVLGILSERGLLGGKKHLSLEKAREAIRVHIAEPLHLSVEDAAAAIYAVQNAQTGDLLRKVVVEAGHDPRKFVVYAFGGAGPANCAAYAAEIGVKEVVVPLGAVASAFSAFGLATSDVALAAEASDPGTFPLDPQRVEKNFAALSEKVREAMNRQGVAFSRITLHREIDLRYSMQIAELAVPVKSAEDGPIDNVELEAILGRFEQKYTDLYGADTAFREAGVQALTFRVRAVGALPFSPTLPAAKKGSSPDSSAARSGIRPVRLGGPSHVDTSIYDYEKLLAGHVIEGPAIVEVPTTTVVVPAGTTSRIDGLGNLVIQTAHATGAAS